MSMPKRTAILAVAILMTGGALVTRASSAQPASQEKVFWMVTVEVPLSKLPAYHAFSQETLTPLQAQHGYRWVASWQTIVGDIEEVIAVAEFASMNHYLTARKSLLASPEWAAAGKQLDSMSRGIRTRLLRATPYSTMQ